MKFKLLIPLCCMLLMLPVAATNASDQFDLLLKNGRVFDGSGNPWFKADVGVRDGRIVALSRAGLTGTADQILDVTGSVVAPGFIDLHSHADDFSGAQTGLRSEALSRRQAVNIVSQGVTTIVVNPDGSAPPGLSIGAQARALMDPGVGVNVILMAGHNAIRYEVMGDDHQRPASAQEILAMGERVSIAMRQGAFGLSSGLEYPPGRYSETEELVSLMRVVGNSGGIHISHIRSETSAPMWWVPSQDEPSPPQLLDGTAEIIRIAEQTHTVGVITHMKVRGTTHWGQGLNVIELVEAARARGVQIYGDQYPYQSSGSDGALVLIPRWAIHVDGPDPDFAAALAKTLAEPGNRELVDFDIKHSIAFRGGAKNIVVFDHPQEDFVGENLYDLARRFRLSEVDMALKLQFEGYKDRPGGVRLRSFSLAEADMEALMQRPWVATASDGGVAIPIDGPTVHARYYGTFPRKIAHYVRKRGALGLAHAIRAGTSLPAQILGLDNRGVIRVGAVADLIVFNPDTFEDRATFQSPHQTSTGLEHVWIAGKPAVHKGQPTKLLLGRVLTKSGQGR
ncbi:MAG: amidohydrolase family protein [Pseudomonadota bacterium]